MILLIPAFIAGWLLTLVLLAVEHLLWKDAPRVVRYCLGAGTICAGCTLTGVLLDNPIIAFGPWVIASAGVATAGWTWYDDHSAAKARSAQKRGEIVGAARGLTQELIDRGTERPFDQN